MVLLNMSLPQLVLMPPLVLLAAGVALFNFQNLFRFLSVGLKDYMTIPIVQTMRPYVNHLKHALEQVLGKASAFKFNLSHVLMMAVVLMLLAVYNAVQRNNELQEQQIKLLLAAQKKKKSKQE
ncbi:hypothetical protein PybrP1_011543 [[Pythium] brassicae (nom. inval.)]|nr:hypothetical protein PybrP1_011543 [[Pythium] brassicae (nom. inval.)]